MKAEATFLTVFVLYVLAICGLWAGDIQTGGHILAALWRIL